VIADAPDGVVIDVKVIPRAGRSRLAGTRDQAILIRLSAAPVDGAANTELIDFLARLLEIPKRQIAIVSGEKSRTKRLRVTGVTAETVRARIAAAGGQ
jgi:uncharacterized protein (TIGR00251 family)